MCSGGPIAPFIFPGVASFNFGGPRGLAPMTGCGACADGGIDRPSLGVRFGRGELPGGRRSGAGAGADMVCKASGLKVGSRI